MEAEGSYNQLPRSHRKREETLGREDPASGRAFHNELSEMLSKYRSSILENNSSLSSSYFKNFLSHPPAFNSKESYVVKPGKSVTFNTAPVICSDETTDEEAYRLTKSPRKKAGGNGAEISNNGVTLPLTSHTNDWDYPTPSSLLSEHEEDDQSLSELSEPNKKAMLSVVVETDDESSLSDSTLSKPPSQIENTGSFGTEELPKDNQYRYYDEQDRTKDDKLVQSIRARYEDTAKLSYDDQESDRVRDDVFKFTDSFYRLTNAAEPATKSESSSTPRPYSSKASDSDGLISELQGIVKGLNGTLYPKQNEKTSESSDYDSLSSITFNSLPPVLEDRAPKVHWSDFSTDSSAFFSLKGYDKRKALVPSSYNHAVESRRYPSHHKDSKLLRDCVKQAEHRIKHYEKIISELQTQILELEHNLSLSRESERQKIGECQRLQSACMQVLRAWKQHNHQVNELQQDKEKWKQRAAQQGKVVESLQSEKIEVMSEMKLLEEEKQMMETTKSQLAEHFQLQLQQREQTNQQLKKELDSIKNRLEEAENQAKDSAQQHQEAIDKLLELEQNANKIEKQYGVLEKENLKLKNELEESNKSLQTASEKNESWLLEKKTIEFELEKSRNELEKSKSELKGQYQKRLEEFIRQQMDDSERERDQMRRQNDKEQHNLKCRHEGELQALTLRHEERIGWLEAEFEKEKEVHLESKSRVEYLEQQREKVVEELQRLLQHQWQQALRVLYANSPMVIQEAKMSESKPGTFKPIPCYTSSTPVMSRFKEEQPGGQTPSKLYMSADSIGRDCSCDKPERLLNESKEHCSVSTLDLSSDGDNPFVEGQPTAREVAKSSDGEQNAGDDLLHDPRVKDYIQSLLQQTVGQLVSSIKEENAQEKIKTRDLVSPSRHPTLAKLLEDFTPTERVNRREKKRRSSSSNESSASRTVRKPAWR